MVSSVILSILIFSTLGFAVGQLWHKYKKSNHTSTNTNSAATRMDKPSEHEQDLEMTENVAYGPLKINTPSL